MSNSVSNGSRHPMKPRDQYTRYTPALINELVLLTKGRERSDAVKAVGRYLKLSERQARAVYAQYLDGAVVASDTTALALAPVRKFKRLYVDIETSPNVVLSWRIGYKINLDHDNILKERAIICVAYKWEGDKKVHVIAWDKDQNDKSLLQSLIPVLNEADEIIAHNGGRFDVPWIRTRALYHGLPPLPQYKVIDTLTWARRQFMFNSNKLDYIARFLGLGGKIKTHFGLWKEVVLNKCPKALDEMCRYCQKDTALLEEVWSKLSTMVVHKSHIGVLAGGEKWTSPHTGSTNVKINKTRVTAGGTIQYGMQCLDTGRYYTISATAHSAYLIAKNLS